MSEKAYVAVTGREFWPLHSRERRNNANAKLARKDGGRVISLKFRINIVGRNGQTVRFFMPRPMAAVVFGAPTRLIITVRLAAIADSD